MSKHVYQATRLGLRVVLPILTSLTVRGRHNVPATGPCLLVGNHLSMLDPPLLAYVPRHVHFMAIAGLFEWRLLAFVFRLFEPIEVRRGHPDRRALRQAEEYLKQGDVVMIYPEGTRSKTRTAIEAHAGAVLLAQRTDPPIVPVAVSGTERIFSQRFPWYRRGQVRLTFGTPFRLADLGVEAGADRDALARAMMLLIAALLPPEYRGVYASGMAPAESQPAAVVE